MTDRLDSIAVFIAVADLGSFARAARRLNRTPVAVTRAVASLEAEAGMRLLNRTTRQVALTEEGARYLEGARRLLTAYDDLRALESDDRSDPRGIVSLTAPGNFGRVCVVPSIARFLERYTRIDVRAQFVDRVVSLVEEGLDLGVRLGNLPDSSLRAIRVGHVRVAIYASPDYLARHGEPRDFRDLADHWVISALPTMPSPDRWSIDRPDGVVSVAVKPRLVVSTPEAAAEAAAEGAGLALSAAYHAQTYVEAGRLRRVLADVEPAPIPIHIVQPAGRFAPTRVRLFVDHLAQDLRRQFG
jgi:DNA-binding transcriptional LysR family regulator